MEPLGNNKKSEAKKQWLKDNPEKARAACKRWRAKNKEKARALCTAWRLNNPDKQKASMDNWKKNNKESMRYHEKLRRERKSSAEGRCNYKEWKQQVEYFNYACAYCLKPLVKIYRDHVVPLSRGGSAYIENLVPSCFECNSDKSAKSLLQFIGNMTVSSYRPISTPFDPHNFQCFD